ncbi:hypothetical protein, partial [Terrimonas pollutisoli]|uniref:hypothetical protein n=1 Tax=Terrimonas pollutisoli TaxID=3034147 RepID=UPI0023EDFF9B
MKKFSNQYKTKNTGKQAGHFWLSLLQWLRLLVLSFKRIRDFLSGVFFHEPDKLVSNKMHAETTTPPKLTDNKKLPNMKPAKLLIKWGLMLLLTVCATNAMAQAPPPIPGDHSVCVNTTKEYGVPYNVGSTYAWSITPNTGFTLTPNPTWPNLITVTWTAVGVYTMTVIETNADGCAGDPVSIVITVNELPLCSITGPDDVCPGSTNTYSAPPGMSTYNWSISGNGTISGATNGQTVSVLADNICGSYTLTVTITDANGCTSTCSQTFDITAPPVVLTAPADFIAPSCQTQAQIDAAYATWLAGVTSSGGCTLNVTNNSTGAPLACGGTATVIWTATSPCEPDVTAQATFTVTAPTPVVITAPADTTVNACDYADQAALNAAIVAWAGRSSVSGGCDPQLSNDAGAASVQCTGGSVTVTWTATDLCQSPTLTRTFTVTAPAPVVITTPVATTVNTCDFATQAELDAAFQAWLATASVTGGCAPVLTNN